MSQNDPQSQTAITHHETESDGRFGLGEKAELTYRRPRPDVMDVDHTWTDPALRGQGIAHQLYRAMTEFARSHDRKVIPSCPYVARMFERHPEDAKDLQAPG
ncbi:GNAT family N-acetyltransferase [Elongatibacter sediminis]|uniref:GNAT family N-acetyltransferase n=1 Tax=Elongatibacter sediminis TaxID=3119006 RepID=A0AAW9RKB6_9GAMM